MCCVDISFTDRDVSYTDIYVSYAELYELHVMVSVEMICVARNIYKTVIRKIYVILTEMYMPPPGFWLNWLKARHKLPALYQPAPVQWLGCTSYAGQAFSILTNGKIAKCPSVFFQFL